MEVGELVGRGRTAEVYAWGSDRVLKLYFDWMGREPIERELRMTKAAGELSLPVPAAEGIVEREGRIGIVFERLVGRPLGLIAASNPAKAMEAAVALGELHALMHSRSLPAGLLPQRAQIEYGISAAKGFAEEDRAAALAALAALAGLPEGDSVCHGDFHPDNVILTERGPFIIDWMCASRGNPLADVARTELLLMTGGLPPRTRPASRALMRSARGMVFRRYIRAYSRASASPRVEFDAWSLPIAAARLFELEGYPDEKRDVMKRIRGRSPRASGGFSS